MLCVLRRTEELQAQRRQLLQKECLLQYTRRMVAEGAERGARPAAAPVPVPAPAAAAGGGIAVAAEDGQEGAGVWAGLVPLTEAVEGGGEGEGEGSPKRRALGYAYPAFCLPPPRADGGAGAGAGAAAPSVRSVQQHVMHGDGGAATWNLSVRLENKGSAPLRDVLLYLLPPGRGLGAGGGAGAWGSVCDVVRRVKFVWVAKVACIFTSPPRRSSLVAGASRPPPVSADALARFLHRGGE